MGAMKELDLRRRNGEPNDDVGSLTEIARALSGEVTGRRVLCPSPGRPSDDRSMVLCIDPARPKAFFVYACEGSYHRARELVGTRLKFVTDFARPATERSAVAQRIWAQCEQANGTLVERYLRNRAISLPVPDALRFHPALSHQPTGSTWPAMVALVTGRDGAPAAIHRTFLARDGRGKAPIEPNKMTLGPIGGGAIRLAPSAAGLLVGEGIETCLSAMQASGTPAWSALSAVGIRLLELPATAIAVTILADGDDAGEAAARAAASRWIKEGRRVRIARAPAGKDFNDLLIAEAAP